MFSNRCQTKPSLIDSHRPLDYNEDDLLKLHEADHLPPSSAEVKNEWRDTSTEWCLVKHGIRPHGAVIGEAQGQFYLY